MTVTLITGTSSGIGFATTLHLASRGHKVYASMRDLNRGQSLREAANDRQLPIELIPLDVNDDASVQSAVASVLEREGQIDVVINNAGIGPIGAIECSDDAMAKRVFETNFFGALRVMRAVLPTMREKRSGTVVNISSVAGRVAPFCMGIYSASKFALEAASESLASEVYPFGIRVVVIEPGFVSTPILQHSLDSIPINEHSPYASAERRTHLLFSQAQQTGSDPQTVAESIELALGDADRRFRYRVTPDAEVLVAGRSRMSDEDWIAIGRHGSDEEFFQEFASRFPMPA